MECIIAMVVMVICATILAMAALSVVNHTRTAKYVTAKVNEQSDSIDNRTAPERKDAEGNQIKTTITLSYGDDYSINIKEYEASTTLTGFKERAGNMKYFVLDK